jgi:hypothetical protein
MTALRRLWLKRTLASGFLGLALSVGPLQAQSFLTSPIEVNAPRRSAPVALGEPRTELPVPGKDDRVPPAANEGTQAGPVADPGLRQAQRSDARYSDFGTETFSPHLDLPGDQALFRLESEESWQTRLRQYARQKGRLQKLTFPDSNIQLAPGPFQPRVWPAQVEVVEPYYVAYRRLYLQQINAERYGWDLGLLHPFMSACIFYFDLATVPFQIIAEPCRRYEYNTGYCLPGDPVPLLLYPPRPK